MKFLRSLTESRLLSSDTAYRRFHARTISELAVLHICALRILANDKRTTDWARQYAQKSARILKFAKFYSATTDLSLLMYAVLNADDVEFRQNDDSQDFMEGVHPNEHEITQWLGDIASGRHNESRARRLFTHLDHDFAITNTSVRSIRRLVQDWPQLDNMEHKLAMTRLLQILRAKASQSDILAKLEEYSHEVGLEITQVSNTESPRAQTEPRKKNGFLNALGNVAAVAIGYKVAKKFLETELEEDAGAAAAPAPAAAGDGVTTTANIATNAFAVGNVQRRRPPTAK